MVPMGLYTLIEHLINKQVIFVSLESRQSSKAQDSTGLEAVGFLGVHSEIKLRSEAKYAAGLILSTEECPSLHVTSTE